MYEELVNDLRYLAKVYSICGNENMQEYKLTAKAANVIEELCKKYHDSVVLCKECMYAPSGTDGGESRGFALEWPHDEWPENNPCPCKCEDEWYSHKPKPDFFCANGKREER